MLYLNLFVDVHSFVILMQYLYISHTDITFGILVGEQSYRLLCQPGVIDWTEMNMIYSMCSYTGTVYYKYLVYSGQGVHSRIFDEIAV